MQIKWQKGKYIGSTNNKQYTYLHTYVFTYVYDKQTNPQPPP